LSHSLLHKLMVFWATAYYRN